MKQIISDRPDYVFTTATRPWNIKPGDVMPGTYVGIGAIVMGLVALIAGVLILIGK